MQASDRTTVPAFTIGMETCGNLAPPFRFDGKVAIARRGHTSRSNFPRDSSQERVTKKANFSRFAVDGAAMLAGFYHRSVLRCGCLAERKSGVTCILSAARQCENICLELSRIGYPGQPRGIIRNLLATERTNRKLSRGCGRCLGCTVVPKLL